VLDLWLIVAEHHGRGRRWRYFRQCFGVASTTPAPAGLLF